MKDLPKKLASLCVLLTAGHACFGGDMAQDARTGFSPDEWAPVSDEQLSQMGGGFELGSGLNVSFGIVRTVTINGDLVNKTSFELPNVAQITAEQARTVSAAIADAGIVQNGAGNFLATSVRSELVNGTLIQNSLNDQNIQTLTIINTGVNSLGLFKAVNTQTVLNDALLRAASSR